VPSLPGYAFSDKPRENGWDVMRVAKAWIVLMRRLGYHRYIAQGGDWDAGTRLPRRRRYQDCSSTMQRVRARS
jgi:hypothetical protein